MAGFNSTADTVSLIADNEIGTLNVAGPRVSKKPEVGEFVMGF